MPHFMVDDGAAFHAKFVAAGNAAVGLWTRAGAWSQQPQNLTEGFIPAEMARTLGSAAQIRKLVAVKLWHEVPGGYQFHEWDGRQMSRAEILDRRRKRAEAGRLGGLKSGRSRRSNDEASASSENEASASLNGVAAPAEFSNPPSNCAHDAIKEESDIDPLETHLPAETRSNDEASAEAKTKQNGTPVPVPVKNSGHLGGLRYVSNASDSQNPPPKFHPEHPTAYEPGCADCERVGRRYERHVALALADTEPSPYCDRHPGGTLDRCRDCGRNRELNAQWHADRHHAAALAQSEAARTAAEDRHRAIVDCGLCDDTGYRDTAVCDHDPGTLDRARRGMAAVKAALAQRNSATPLVPAECTLHDQDGWRIPPPELRAAEPPRARCDHRTTLPAEWRALIAELLTTPTEETSNA